MTAKGSGSFYLYKVHRNILIIITCGLSSQIYNNMYKILSIVFALVAAASAGYLGGYGLGYGYATHAPLAVAHAPLAVAHAPLATSYANAYRTSSTVRAIAPVATVAHAPLAVAHAPLAVAHAPLSYGGLYGGYARYGLGGYGYPYLH